MKPHLSSWGIWVLLGAGTLLIVFVVIGRNRYEASHDPSIGETLASVLGFLFEIASFFIFF